MLRTAAQHGVFLGLDAYYWFGDLGRFGDLAVTGSIAQ